MDKKIRDLIDIFITIFAGTATGYLLASIVTYLVIPYSLNLPALKTATKTQAGRKLNLKKVILQANILSIKTGASPPKSGLTTTKRIKASIVSNINGYRLIGFVSGKNPMALFKKKGKPVVIVTRKKGLNGVWVLYSITKNGVYLKNSKTGKIKLFEFPHTKTTKLSAFGPPTIEHKASTGNFEKITVSRKIANRLSNINLLLKQINITPVFRNRKAIGYRINYIARNSILNRIGLKVGDIIVSINGEPTTSPDKIMELYSQIKNMTAVNLDVIRRGRRKTIFIQIR